MSRRVRYVPEGLGTVAGVPPLGLIVVWKSTPEGRGKSWQTD